MRRRGLIIFAALGVLVFAGLAFYGDLPELLEEISSLPVVYWLAVLGLALSNYLIRLLRWHYYLSLLGVRIGLWTSAAIFLSGLSMAISPGRVGELAKAYLLKEKLDAPVALSSTVVITERITDVVSVLLLSLWGLTLVPYGWAVALVVFGVFAGFILLVATARGSRLLLRLPLPSRWRPFLGASRDAFQNLLSPRPFAIGLVLGAMAWFAEGLGLWLVLRGLDATASLGEAVSIYSAATLLGAITMLPGGLVGTEVGMVALLKQVDLTKIQASSATVIIRLCTLWFAVLVGTLAVIYVQVFMPRQTGVIAEREELDTELPGRAS